MTLRTAAQAAAERGVSESRMRGLLAEHGVRAVARQPGRDGVNLYNPADLAAIPSPQQGTRNDILGQLTACCSRPAVSWWLP